MEGREESMETRCEGHDELVMLAAKNTASSEAHTAQINEMFSLLREVKESVDKNLVRAEQRDRELASIKETVRDVDRKIENGLKKKIDETAASIEKMKECLDRRKEERAEERKRGLSGYFRRGYESFKDRSAYIVVTTIIITVVLTLLWLVVKFGIHTIAPNALLKLFGIIGV